MPGSMGVGVGGGAQGVGIADASSKSCCVEQIHLRPHSPNHERHSEVRSKRGGGGRGGGEGVRGRRRGGEGMRGVGGGNRGEGRPRKDMVYWS